MTISVVHVVGNSIVGGAECHVVDLVEGLRAHGIQSHVVIPRPGPFAELLRSRNVNYEQIEFLRVWPSGRTAPDLKSIRDISLMLRDVRPAIVHSHLFPATFFASLAAHEVRVPGIVHTEHNVDVHPGVGWMSRKTGAYTIAVANSVARAAISKGVHPSKIEVIYNCAAPHHFSADRQAAEQARRALGLSDGPIVGTVARLAPEKGVDVFLRAISITKETIPSLTVLVIGEGRVHAELRMLSESLGLNGIVRFLGTRSDVPLLYRLMDIFVLASRREGCPLVVLEAMAAGTPVVATAVDGSSEIIDHGRTGWLVPSENPSALAEGLLLLLSDQLKRQSLALNAYRAAASSFTLEAMSRRVASLYERILSQA